MPALQPAVLAVIFLKVQKQSGCELGQKLCSASREWVSAVVIGGSKP